MFGDINDGGLYSVNSLSRTVAPHAERIVLLGKLERTGMRVMAVQTGDARLAHAAQAQPRFTIVLVPLHAVGPEHAGLDGEHQLKVVVKTVAHGKS